MGEKLDRAILDSLTGQYVLGPTTVSVSIRGDNMLTLMIPGQPVYELVCTRGLVFDVRNLPGYSIEFKRNSSGAVSEAVFSQPNGTLVARRK